MTRNKIFEKKYAIALKWKCLGKMRQICLSNNGSGMSLDTRKLILDFRDTVIIVTPGFPGHARHTRNSGVLLAMLSGVRDLKLNTKFHTCSQLCIILWYKGFFNIMELVFFTLSLQRYYKMKLSI